MTARATTTRDWFLADEAATTALGQWLAGQLGAGDVLLLEGAIGAGKTHLARALIQHRLAAAGQYEDVPSPTFTLIQVYDTGAGEIWHADLYRLSGPAELVELGLEEAFDSALCLIEWPDRLGGLAPPRALRLSMCPEGEGRRAILAGPAQRLAILPEGP